MDNDRLDNRLAEGKITMLINIKQCLICTTPWQTDQHQCKSCGAIVEIVFERQLPELHTIDEETVQQAIDHIRNNLITHEQDGYAHYRLAMAYISLGLREEGSQELKRAAQLLPEKVEVAYQAVAMAAKQGEYSADMLRQLQRIIGRRPSFVEALYLKGILLQRNDDISAAIGAWQEALMVDPDYAPPKNTIKRFVDANYHLLTDPQIASRLRQQSLSKKESAYLDLLSWTGKDRPRELGVTSMNMLQSISPKTAKRMRQIHATQVREYEEIEQKRSELTGTMNADTATLTQLCLRAVQMKTHMIASAAAAAATGPAGTRLFSLEERTAILEKEVRRYQRQGYRLISKTATNAQLSKQHEFSCCLAVILTFLIVGIVIYLLYYLTAKKEYYLFLEVDEYGRIGKSFS